MSASSVQVFCFCFGRRGMAGATKRGWQAGVDESARRAKITLWDFRQLIAELAKAFASQRTYFGDDTLRTLHLFALAEAAADKTPD